VSPAAWYSQPMQSPSHFQMKRYGHMHLP
jgi:hypothetical protein